MNLCVSLLAKAVFLTEVDWKDVVVVVVDLVISAVDVLVINVDVSSDSWFVLSELSEFSET